MRDMELTMTQLAQQTASETVLGAVMFSCSGRGPTAGFLMTEEMADARRFANAFSSSTENNGARPSTSSVPCCGFYAAGEIGPMAIAGRRRACFQQGKTALQGFTAVFALFIAPVFDLSKKRLEHDLDDSQQSVEAFVRSRLR